MELKHLNGCIDAETVFVEGRVMLAKKRDGAWVALNYVSTDPAHLRNRSQRTAWALAQGLKAKDVEAYVRREKAREKRETEQRNVLRAISILKSKGYVVTEVAKVTEKK